MRQVRTLGLIGGGVIGAGWAARAALNGIDVTVCDMDPQAERKIGQVLANARRAFGRLTQAPLPREGMVRIVRSIEAAVEAADFIQESLPEREDLKIALLAQADRAARPDAVIGSSTSGLRPTRLQSEMRHPKRLVVGHPFNPVYLIPLVEICGGAATSEEVRQTAATFYASLGMRPLQVRKEIDGFIADRLMEALWRESLWLIHDDIATVAEIDDAMRFGPGLRWASMGSFLIYRIAGGEAGMRHFMAQFGPALKWPWSRLTDVPELDDALLDKIVAQSDAQAGTASVGDLERLRDDCLVAILQALKGRGYAAGETLAAYEKHLLAADTASVGVEAESAPLRLYDGRVEPSWIDYNDHMTESSYLLAFSHATDALLARIGADTAYVAAGRSYYTIETHIMHLQEMKLYDAFYVTTQILAADEKRLHVWHAIHRSIDHVKAATAEQMLMHVDARAGRSGPADAEVLARLRPIADTHATLPRPSDAGRGVGIRPRNR